MLLPLCRLPIQLLLHLSLLLNLLHLEKPDLVRVNGYSSHQ